MPRRKAKPAPSGRQTTLFEFLYEPIRHLYIPMRKAFPDRHGLAEREIKRRLEKQGWIVWRGELVGLLRHARNHPEQELYANVKKKYELLELLLNDHHPSRLDDLQYLSAVHHGMPDYLCYRQGRFLFVECKLCHEQLSRAQKFTIRRLQALGFGIEVHKLVDHRTKLRSAAVSIETNVAEIKERQLRLSKRLAASMQG